MPEATYTLILTQGIHTVDEATALALRSAIECGQRIVDVDIDLFGGSDSSRNTMIVTAHVIAISAAAPRSSLKFEPRSGMRVVR